MKEEIIKQLEADLFTAKSTRAFAESKISGLEDITGNPNRMKEHSEFILVEQNCRNKIDTLEKSIKWLKDL